MTESRGNAIGIDLGTTYSCVGVFKHNNVEIIANDQGNRTTPSYVSFSPDSVERLCGDAAKNQASRNPANTVFDAKRLIGRGYYDSHVQKDKEFWPFRVIPDPSDSGNSSSSTKKPKIEVEFNGEKKTYYPEEISSIVLSKMKEIAETFIGEDVTDAVITVPAYFSDGQRQATKDAALIAGLNPMRILNEPTAAAIAYGLDKNESEKGKKEKNILIYDMGGGTFDVSLLKMEKGVFEVRATAGDTHLGGEDFDSRLVEHCLNEFKRKFPAYKDENLSQKALRRLRTQCERCKRTLSANVNATIEVDGLHGGEDFSVIVTRAKFEELCMDYFKNSMIPVEKCLVDAGCYKDGKLTEPIDEVVLVGGSTRIPKVQELLSEFFDGKELCRTINPDEAVAYGATVQAAILSGNMTSEGSGKDLLLLDVTPLSLGVELYGGVFSVIIPRNSSIPCRKTQTYTTDTDNQTEENIKIYEGERYKSKDNNLLGSFLLEGIPRAPKGQPQLDVTFDLDANGILNVTAKCRDSGSTSSVQIKNDKGRLNADDIKRMIDEAKQFKAEDRKLKEVQVAREDLMDYCQKILFAVSEMVGEDGEEGKEGKEEEEKEEKAEKRLNDNEIEKLKSACSDAQEWLNVNEDITAIQIAKKKRETEAVCKPLITKMNSAPKKTGTKTGGSKKNRRR